MRKRDLEPPLFYSTQEIAGAAPQGFYARLGAALKDRWEELAAPVRALFTAGWGRPTDPIVYLKCFLIGYFENITYDTDLAERIADSLSLRSFLGYTLTERTPDHSSLSRVRARLGEGGAIEKVLEAAVRACVEAGLVGGEVTAVDATLLPANAAFSSLHKIATGKPVREHLAEVRARNEAGEEGEKRESTSLSNGDFVSGTDPEAKLARTPRHPRDLYYRATHVTDEKNQIILAAAGGTAERGEAEAAKEPLTQAQETLKRNGLKLGTVLGDAGYDAADLHAHIEGLEGTPLTYLQREGSQKPEGFKKSDFRYEAEQDCYWCPAGKQLPRVKGHGERIEYRGAESDCPGCPHREACVGKGKGQTRSLWRVKNEASRERNRARAESEEGRALLARRKTIVEAPFGHHKTYGGLVRLNCRGVGKVHVRVVLAAVAWDLITLVKALFPEAALPAPRAAREGESTLLALPPPPGLAPTPFCRRALAAISSWLHPSPSLHRDGSRF